MMTTITIFCHRQYKVGLKFQNSQPRYNISISYNKIDHTIPYFLPQHLHRISHATKRTFTQRQATQCCLDYITVCHAIQYAFELNLQKPWISDIGLVWRELQWRHNRRDSVSNQQPRECLLSRLIRLRSKKTSKLRVTGLCAGNSPETDEFPSQRANNAENFPFDDVIMLQKDRTWSLIYVIFWQSGFWNGEMSSWRVLLASFTC